MHSVSTSEKSLFHIFSFHDGYISDKWEQYLGIYESELRAIVEVDTPLRLLEIGVQNGGSLEIWSKYLPAGSSIVGIDIDEKCASLKFGDSIQILIGDAANKGFLEAALGDASFDIIIDDGSHQSADIIASFNALLPRLNLGGKYFIEDTHTSYWRSHGGGFRTPDSAIEFLKSLIDPLHLDHLEKDVRFDFPNEETCHAINRQVARISFYDSIAVIEKYRHLKERSFKRVLSGECFSISGQTAEWKPIILSGPDNLAFCGDSAQGIVTGLAHDLEQVQSELARQTAESAEHREAVERMQSHLAQQTAEYQAVVQGLQTDLAQRTAEYQELKAELAQQTAEYQAVVQGLQTDLAQRTVEHRTVVERLETELARQTAEYEGILSSISWRATTPIRNILGRSPWITRQGRRVLEVLNMTIGQHQRSLQEGHANRQSLKPDLLSLRDASLLVLVRSFYKAAFGREADSDALAAYAHKLRSGISPETLAEELVRSAEFRTRHGSSQRADIDYLTALYRDGLGREPDPEGLAHWLAEAGKGISRAKVLAAFAGSAEAMEKLLLPTPPAATAPETSRATAPPDDAALSRNEILLAPVPRKGHVIEIGPSYNPIAPKSEGWNTRTLDHTTRESLVTKYRGQPGVDVNRIEEVDFIWTTGSLIDAVPGELHGTFDAFIASHVIEHTPDLIAFLDSAAGLLNQSGIVVLAIPDKRYCFDYFQPLTTTGQVLAAHAEYRSRHTRRIAFDHAAYAVQDGGAGAWGQHPSRGFRFFHTIEDARNLFTSISDKEEYVDLHAWRFTPASFELLMLELARLGETDWRVERVTPPTGCEFYTWLRRGGKAYAALLTQAELDSQRLALLKRTLLQTREQINWLLAGEPNINNIEKVPKT